MKTHLPIISLTALTLGLATTAANAQSPAFPSSSTWGTQATTTSTFQTTSTANDAFKLSNLAGKPVRGQNNDELGTVSDFLIDAQSGKVQFAIVPSGRGAAGETFRLVPMAAVDTSAGQDGLTVRLSRSQWDQVGTMTGERLQGQVSLNADLVERNARQFSLNGQENTGAVANLQRATALRGQPVRAGNDQVGTVDDVLIDVAARSAAIALKPASATSTNQAIVVPFTQLQFNDQGAITTNLPAAQFQQSLTPTGYASGVMSQGQAAAVAVQQALANNTALGANAVQVVPESRLVLRGTVSSAQQRADVERTAAQAAPGMPIENQIQVRGW